MCASQLCKQFGPLDQLKIDLIHLDIVLSSFTCRVEM